MTADKQCEANRQNAQNSTGPKTEEGKQASRRNALKHGLTAQLLIDMAPELKSQFDALCQRYQTYYKPHDVATQNLVSHMARLEWLLQDVHRLCFEAIVMFQEDPMALSMVLNRYSTYESRLFNLKRHAQKDLLALQEAKSAVSPEAAQAVNPPSTLASPVLPQTLDVKPQAVVVPEAVKETIPSSRQTSQPIEQNTGYIDLSQYDPITQQRMANMMGPYTIREFRPPQA